MGGIANLLKSRFSLQEVLRELIFMIFDEYQGLFGQFWRWHSKKKSKKSDAKTKKKIAPGLEGQKGTGRVDGYLQVANKLASRGHGEG